MPVMLHLGGNELIPLAHVIAILDIHSLNAKDTLASLGKPHPPGDARSVIITHAHGRSGIRFSSISSQTLLHRQQGVKP